MKKRFLVFLLVGALLMTASFGAVDAAAGSSTQSEDDNPLTAYLAACLDRGETPSVESYLMFLRGIGISVPTAQVSITTAFVTGIADSLDSPLAEPQSVVVRTTLLGPYQQGQVTVGPTQNHQYVNLAGKLILATASTYWPIISFVHALVSWISFPTIVYGNVSSTTTNVYSLTETWYEILNQYGQWEPFVITQFRHTNLIFHEVVTSTVWPYPSQSASEVYNGLRYQISYRWGHHSANEAEAVDRYYRGWGLQVYTYNGYGSTDVINTYLLP